MTDMIDMSRFVEAKSDQLNADDLIGTSRTITVTRVSGSEGDQPVSIHYEGDNGKPFKPCKTMRRVLLGVWGKHAADYVGRSMTLYRDDSVTFSGLAVGGIRISHMSHIDGEKTIVVMKSKGKKAGIKVRPLANAPATKRNPARDLAEEINACETTHQLRDWWDRNNADISDGAYDHILGIFNQRLAAVKRRPAPAYEPEGPDDSQRGESHTGADGGQDEALGVTA